MKIKVCGMKYSDNIKTVANLNPDYMGFIFYDKSSRFVADKLSVEQLKKISAKRIGVFVNASLDFIIKNVKEYKIDIIQLHGDENPSVCKQLKAKNLSILKAFQIDESFDFSLLNSYKPYIDFFLFDTKSSQYGGTGKQFDWAILKQYDNEKPFFLSGGIGPEDATKIINSKLLKQLNIHALDINSKFETNAALKNEKALQHFINIVRNEIHC